VVIDFTAQIGFVLRDHFGSVPNFSRSGKRLATKSEVFPD